MNICTTHSPINISQNTSFSTRRLLAVGENKRSGLILCKPHYAEFAGPGAAICSPFEANYAQIIAIGSPDIVEVVTYEGRQQAYGRRIQWVRWLHKIVSEVEPNQRAEKLFAGFEEFFGSEVLVGIPNEVLALLAGVLPHTIALLRSQHQDIERGEGQNCPLSINSLDVRVITPDYPSGYADRLTAQFLTGTHFFNPLNPLPCSA
ncbi:MAG: hypothetical protein NW220_16510 [Leptolyngbyaceae cyanobacterium bins.349]|nr:hypothetical protein [Leptolyngbyaceae cyanobacterium bins.349]